MSKSAACGAWKDFDGEPAHSHCTGSVALPSPDDRCTCSCHNEAEGVSDAR